MCCFKEINSSFCIISPLRLLQNEKYLSQSWDNARFQQYLLQYKLFSLCTFMMHYFVAQKLYFMVMG